ncbi:hypothetical protein [Nitrobacter sp.]|uniref:hypothetical protein n=1 Tax=unclassified Nitrobacter TaxID=2620411 RepID=UPI00321F8F58
MRQAGRVVRFWVTVFGVVVGLQSACVPVQSDEIRGSGAAIDDSRFRLAFLMTDVAGLPRDRSVIRVSEVSAEDASPERKETSAEDAPPESKDASAEDAPPESKDASAEDASPESKEVPAASEEVSTERERDHSARSLQEMLAWFLKGAGLLTAMVLFYKGLKWWVLRNRQSE